jgi:zinc protease
VFLARGKYLPYTLEAPDPARFKPSALTVTLIDKPGATDNQILFVYPQAFKEDAPQYAVAEVAHLILGGGVTGRLGDALRNRRGLTYHAGTFLFSGLPMWAVWTFGGLEQTPALIKGVAEVIAAFRKEKLTAIEVREAVSRSITRFRADQELPAERLFERARFRRLGLDPTSLDRHERALAAVDAAAVHAFAARQIDARGGHLYVMGDRTKLTPLLEKLLPPEGKLRVRSLADIF